MTLTFPRPLPVPHRIAKLSLVIDRVLASARTRGGAVQIAERGRSLWRFAGTTTALTVREYEAWRAFLDSMRGGANTFLAYDLQRCRPLAYPGSDWAGFTRHLGGAFDGTADIVGASGYEVTIADLPSTFILSVGDYLSWPWRSSRTLHRIVEGGVATNGVVTVQVEPDVPDGGAIPETVKIEQADALFRLIETPEPARGGSLADPISLTAIQALF